MNPSSPYQAPQPGQQTVPGSATPYPVAPSAMPQPPMPGAQMYPTTPQPAVPPAPTITPGYLAGQQPAAPAAPYYGSPNPAAAPAAAPPALTAQVTPPYIGAPVAAPHTANPGVAPVPQSNPNSTQNTLQIAEIRDGIVIMSDGSFRSVVMAKSINFDLMSHEEQEAVEYSYQNFLNSLYFPVQMFIRSQKVDLAPYIERLDKIRSEHDNMLLALLMDDYINYMSALAEQTNIMDKKFYIIIPFFPQVDVQRALTQSKNFLNGVTALFDKKEQHVVINEEELEKAKAELRNRVQAVLNGLMQCSIQALPLDTQELIELFYDTYNPDTATRQQLKDFNQLDADVVVKGVGNAPQPHLDREIV